MGRQIHLNEKSNILSSAFHYKSFPGRTTSTIIIIQRRLDQQENNKPQFHPLYKPDVDNGWGAKGPTHRILPCIEVTRRIDKWRYPRGEYQKKNILYGIVLLLLLWVFGWSYDNRYNRTTKPIDSAGLARGPLLSPLAPQEAIKLEDLIWRQRRIFNNLFFH